MQRRTRPTSPSMEQYIETISHLLTQASVCSVSDIAAHANVSRPAASRAVRDLAAKSLVQHKTYGYVELTPQGHALAKRLNARHEILYSFLSRVLRFDDEYADREACRLEHQIEDDIIGRLAQLAAFLDTDEAAQKRWIEQLKHYLEDIP